MKDLIARLEQASEGSRELSWSIAEAVGWKKYWSGQTIYLPPGETEEWADSYPEKSKASTKLPAFTTSLDDAMTLIPEGWWLRSIEGVPRGDEWGAEVAMAAPPWLEVIGPANENVGSPTPALALCIAALRARDAEETPDAG